MSADSPYVTESDLRPLKTFTWLRHLSLYGLGRQSLTDRLLLETLSKLSWLNWLKLGRPDSPDHQVDVNGSAIIRSVREGRAITHTRGLIHMVISGARSAEQNPFL